MAILVEQERLLFMRRLAIVTGLLAVAAALLGQSGQNRTSDIGFTYGLPPAWSPVPIQPPSPPTNATSALAPLAKKGTACIQMPQTARHGDPASVIIVVTLPFDCYGQTMAADDLPGFGSGAAEGLKQAFDLFNPVYGIYSLGSHPLWIERAKGNPKGRSDAPYTVEIVCTILKKGAACWMTVAADEPSLQAFEHSLVTLDGEAATPLVPATAFAKAPS
jgi:hypothetical protein